MKHRVAATFDMYISSANDYDKINIKTGLIIKILFSFCYKYWECIRSLCRKVIRLNVANLPLATIRITGFVTVSLRAASSDLANSSQKQILVKELKKINTNI